MWPGPFPVPRQCQQVCAGQPNSRNVASVCSAKARRSATCSRNTRATSRVEQLPRRSHTTFGGALRRMLKTDENPRLSSRAGNRDLVRQLPSIASGAPPAPMWRTCTASGNTSRSRKNNSSDSCSSKGRRTTSGRGDSQRPPLALGRVRPTCPEVVTRQLRELREELILGSAAGQIPENVPDRDPRAANAGLPKSDGGVDADSIQQAHTASVRQERPRPQSG